MRKKRISSIRARCRLVYGLASLILVHGSCVPQCLAQSSRASASKDQTVPSESEQEYLQAIKTMRRNAGVDDQEAAGGARRLNSPQSDETKYPGIKIISGGEGIPFPEPSQVKLQPFPTDAPLAVETPIPAPSPTPWQKPGRCQNNQTVRVDRSPEASDAEVLYDKLFLEQDLVPTDTQEVFGARADLYPYGGEEEEGAFVRMEIYEVPCVPYRIRMTRRSYFFDSGLNALKNYDKNYAGSGEFHPFIEQRLFGKPKPSVNQRAKRHF